MEYMSFDTTLENLNNQLDEDGVAVIPNVLSEAECIQLRESVWTELKYVTKDRFNFDDITTWREFYNFYPLHSMLLQHFSLGHMQPIWDIRQHPRVSGVFETIWGVEKNDLLVSFDGLSVHLPPEITNKGWFNNKEWFHTDQSFTKRGRCCIQGLVNLYPVNEGDASLAVMRGSHKLHNEIYERYKADLEGENDDWYKLDVHQKQYLLDRGCYKYAVKAGMGSMVLWDSRTFHQGKEPERSRKEDNFRIAVYVCMMPRNMSNEKALAKKRAAFEGLRVTNHWANNPKLFPTKPRTYGGIIPEFNMIHAPVLSDIGRRLAGFN